MPVFNRKFSFILSKSHTNTMNKVALGVEKSCYDLDIPDKMHCKFHDARA